MDAAEKNEVAAAGVERADLSPRIASSAAERVEYSIYAVMTPEPEAGATRTWTCEGERCTVLAMADAIAAVWLVVRSLTDAMSSTLVR
jgi:hypothetical protein